MPRRKSPAVDNGDVDGADLTAALIHNQDLRRQVLPKKMMAGR
jgi:hypothetical protein